MNYKITLLAILILLTGLTGAFFLDASYTSLNIEETDADQIPPQYITDYHDLSNAEQQNFREILQSPSNSERITTENSLTRNFILLDGSTYKVTTNTQLSSLIVFAAFLIAIGSFLLLNQVPSLSLTGDQYLISFAVCVLLISLIPIGVMPEDNSLNTQVKISEQPITTDNSNATTILYLSEKTQERMYDIMKGGASVKQQNATYRTVRIDTAEAKYLRNNTYIQSDGEYYHITGTQKPNYFI